MSTDLLTQLKDLRLYGMSDAWADIKAEAPQRQQALSPEILLRQLINAEITDRQARMRILLIMNTHTAPS